MSKYFLVANWKMYFSYRQACTWLDSHIQELNTLVKTTNTILTICPSFEALSYAQKILTTTAITLGAQNCASHNAGAYTGQVPSQSLAQLGCSFCLVGHSEQRILTKESQEDFVHKISLLQQCTIIPILCIGENKQDYQQELTLKKIEEQLQLIIQLQSDQPLYIAYEPVWSIGTGIVPSANHIATVFAHIKKLFVHKTLKNDLFLLYGGSIDAQSLIPLLSIPDLDGFLVGKASTDFQELKKIVLSIEDTLEKF